MRNSSEVVSTAAVTTVAASEARTRLGLLAVKPGLCAVGPAWPCACPYGDNRALHDALSTAPVGSVLICDAGGDTSHGYFGELMSQEAKRRDIAGLVLDGAIRDSYAVARLGLPVFCRGFAALACTKTSGGPTARAVKLGQIAVSRDDWVVADADGVVFVAAKHWPRILADLQELADREETIKTAMRKGRSLRDFVIQDGDG